MPFLEGPGPVKGFPHAGVLAEERFAVVLDPVYHLREAKQAGHQNGLRGRRRVFVFTGQRSKTSQGS